MEEGFEQLLVETVRRHDLLRTLEEAEKPLRRSRIRDRAGVSSSTAYRAVESLEEKGVVEKTDGGYVLTPYGEVLHSKACELYSVAENGRSARHVLEAVSGTDVDAQPEMFADADATVSEPELPYEPARRFVEMFEDSGSLRLLAASSATPMFSRDMHKLILDGRDTEIVCTETVVEANLDRIPAEEADGMLESLSVYVHGSPPFTLAVFDECVGVGKHDEETGTLDVFVDTDRDDAHDWAEGVYMSYRKDSERYV